MKELLRKLAGPILGPLESGTSPYAYKPSHRTILIVIGVLFSGLASAVLLLIGGQSLGYLLPVIVFGAIGLVCLLVAFLGSDRAVAKIWGSR